MEIMAEFILGILFVVIMSIWTIGVLEVIHIQRWTMNVMAIKKQVKVAAHADKMHELNPTLENKRKQLVAYETLEYLRKIKK